MARALARTALAVEPGRFDADVIAKAKLCLLDFLSCAFEARNHPWSRQAIGIARGVADGIYRKRVERYRVAHASKMS